MFPLTQADSLKSRMGWRNPNVAMSLHVPPILCSHCRLLQVLEVPGLYGTDFQLASIDAVQQEVKVSQADGDTQPQRQIVIHKRETTVKHMHDLSQTLSSSQWTKC
jgi:hypothetical protein